MAQFKVVRILIAIIVALALLMFWASANVYAQATPVQQYGCAALYTSDDPTVLAGYMVELIGHQPMTNQLTSYVEELPTDACGNLDLGRVIFNVCGQFADKHDVCEGWVKEYPKFYSNQNIYNFYSATLQAAQEVKTVSQVSTDVGEVLQHTQPQEAAQTELQEGGGINIVQIIVASLVLSGGLFVLYNWNMNRSPKSKRGKGVYLEQ